MVEFIVPGDPQGKARARTYHNINGVHTVTPEKTVLYENLIKASYLQKYKKRMFELDTPIEIRITAVFEPPASTSNKKRQQMLSGRLLPIKKPDADNICKVVMDAMNKVVYPDDKQAVSVQIIKTYGLESCVIVQVKGIITKGK